MGFKLIVQECGEGILGGGRGRIDHPGQTAGSGSRTLRNTVKNFGAGELGAERSQ